MLPQVHKTARRGLKSVRVESIGPPTGRSAHGARHNAAPGVRDANRLHRKGVSTAFRTCANHGAAQRTVMSNMWPPLVLYVFRKNSCSTAGSPSPFWNGTRRVSAAMRSPCFRAISCSSALSAFAARKSTCKAEGQVLQLVCRTIPPCPWFSCDPVFIRNICLARPKVTFSNVLGS